MKDDIIIVNCLKEMLCIKLEDFDMENKLGKGALLLVAIIWGTGFVASSLALAFYSPIQTLALRFSIAFGVSLLIFRKSIKKINKTILSRGILIGVFLFCAFLFQTIGIKYTTVSKNAFLTATNIIIVPFISYVVLKSKIGF